MKQKILSLLVLLLTAVTGAWAQEETLLVTMTAGETVTYDPATATDVAEITMTGATKLGTWEDYNGGNHYSWLNSSTNVTEKGTLEVTAKPGYTITKVVFSGSDIAGGPGSREVTASPFAVYPWGEGSAFGSAVYTSDSYTEIIRNAASNDILGIDKIEVYGYAGTPAPGIKVTTNAASEGATFTEASFEMPAFDATLSYELVRDMEIDVNAVIANRIRIKKGDNGYEAVTATELMPVIIDELDEQNPVIMVLYNETDKTGDYTVKLQKKVEGETPSWADAEVLSVGTFRYVITGTNLYDGEITTNEFTLFEGYEVVIPAGEYVTYYKDEAVRLEEKDKNDIELYTVSSVSGDKATLSNAFDAAPSNTPFLVYNNTNETKTVLLIPCNEPDLAVTVADEFIGTLTAKEFTEDDMATGDFYVCNGKQFVKVRGAGTLGANKAYLKFVTNQQQSAPQYISISGDLGEGTTRIDNLNVNDNENGEWYDLNGRKLNGKPAQKGIYIKNGKKIVVK